MTPDSPEKFRGLFEAVQETAADAIYLINSAGIILMANSRALQLMNQSREEVIGRHFNDFSPDSLKEERAERFARTLSGEEVKYITAIHPPGRPPLQMEVHSNRVEWGGQQFVFAVMRDISERTANEQSMELYRRIISGSKDAIAILDPKWTYLERNGAHLKLFGFTDAETDGKTPALIVGNTFHDIAREVAATGTYQGMVVCRARDGRDLDIDLTVFSLRDPQGEAICHVAVNRDATSRRTAERRQATLHAVSRALAEKPTIDDAIPVILESIGRTLGWEVGIVWVVDPSQHQIKCMDAWHDNRAYVDVFLEECRRITFPPGIGLPGRVWSMGRAAWIPDVTVDSNFPQAPSAARVGLHAAFSFPIMLGAEVLGTVEFFSRDIRPPDPGLLEMMASAGSHVGQAMGRSRAELASRLSEQHFRTLADNALDLVTILGVDGTIRFSSPSIVGMLGFTPEEQAGHSAFEFIHPEDLAPVADAFQRGLKKPGTEQVVTIRHRHKDGSWRVLEAYGKAIPGVDGQLMVLVYSRDVTERLASAERLNFQKALLEIQSELSIDGILVVSKDMKILSFNRRFTEMWKIPPAILERGSDPEALGAVQHLLAHPQEFLDRVKYLYDHPDEKSHEEILLKDRRIFERYSAPIRNPDGENIGRVWYFRDVTERRTAEEVVRISEERFRSLAMNAPDIILTSDREGIVRFINRTQPGFTVEDIIGRPVYDFTNPEDRDRLRAYTEQVFVTGKPVDYEMGGPGPNGTQAWYSTRIGPTTLEGGKPGVTLFVTDITRRKRAEEALQESLTRLRRHSEELALLLTHAGDFVYRHDVHGVFNYMSPAVEQITGHSAQDWMKHYTQYLTDHPANDKVLEYTNRTLKTGEQSPPYLVEVFHKNGGRIMLEVNERAYLGNGKIQGIIGVARDVTDRERSRQQLQKAARETQAAYRKLKRAQAQLIQTEKLASVGMLVSGVAHEINNPINVLYGNLKLIQQRWTTMRRSLGGSGKAGRDLKAVPAMLVDAIHAAETARETIEEFRNFARNPRVASPSDINECVKAGLHSLEKDLAGIRVVRRLGAVPSVHCFPGQIRQVFVNLVKNALDAMGGRGTLRIRTLVRARRVVIEVEDTGRGIPRKVLKKIFEPFFTTKAEGRGMGLGLPISASIIQHHGGRLRVTSKVGKGTCFQVELPFRK